MPEQITVPAMGLVVLIGISGSGKSTFARTHFKPTEVVSSDFCRGLVADDENDQSATPDAFDVLHYIVSTRLRRGLLTVVDATNNMGGAAPDSRAAITRAVPDVRYVRAFNTLGWENFADPLPGTALFFAAEASARQATEELIQAVGLEPAYVGGPDATGTVDALLPLWFELVKLNGGNRKVALRIVRG